MDKEKIQKIADFYGYEKQSWQCVEELAELIQAICKAKRKRNGLPILDERAHITEEIADCEIMLKQLEYLLNAEYEVSVEIENKLDRQMRRIEGK